MKKIIALLALLFASAANAITYVPVPLLSTTGSTSGQTVLSAGSSSTAAWGNVSAAALTGILPIANGGTNASAASGTALDNISGFSGTGFLTRTGAGAYTFQSATNGITLGNLAQTAANTVLGNFTGSTANVTAFVMPSCSTSTSALQSTSSTGFTCGTVASSGANSNITSLTGLTTALSVAQGGTGRATLTAHGVLLGEGASAINQTAAGTAGQVYTSGGASADPTWGNLGQPYFQAYLSASQTVTANTFTKCQFNTKNFDSGTYYDATTNYRFTPLVAGKYKVTVSIQLAETAGAGTYASAIYKNGAVVFEAQDSITPTTTSNFSVQASAIVSMNGTTDYIEGWGFTPGTTFGAGAPLTYIEAYYIGP